MKKRCPRREINTLEALLFASGEPVSAKDMAKVLSLPEETCIYLAEFLKNDFETKERGISVLKLEDRFQMATSPRYYPVIELLYQQQSRIRLTEVQLETLAIIVYQQPVTRQEVNDIRGVQSDAVISRLIQMDLVEEAGRLKAPGRPILLKTTDAFLKAFKLSSVEDLPKLPDQKAVLKERDSVQMVLENEGSKEPETQETSEEET